MFHGKLRIHTCRVILLTSLVWFLIDVVILSFYSDCLGGSCKKTGEYEVIVADALVQSEDYEDPKNNEISQNGDAESSRSVSTVSFLTFTIHAKMHMSQLTSMLSSVSIL